MNRLFLQLGIVSIVLVAVVIGTRPSLQTFSRELAVKYGVICDEQQFTCRDGKENIEMTDTTVHNGVFFTTIRQTFKTSDNQIKVASGFGMLGTFWRVTMT